jgi:type VI secretion system protein VasJ
MADPSNPIAYRILRALKWDPLVAPPTAVPDTGRTQIPPPRPQLRASLEAMAGAGKWLELVHASEGAFADGFGTFWLDLQRFSATALEGLAGADNRAARLVRDETRRLVECWPQISSLAFKDGTPFVDDTTRQWLTRIGQEAAGAEASSTLASLPTEGRNPADEPPLDPDKIREVQDLFSKKRPAAALDLLQGAIEATTRDRQRFQARLLAARLCLQASQVDWARTLLEDLRREADGFSLAAWEPGVATSLCELSAVCYGRLVKDRKGEERENLRLQLEEMKARVFRLDMRAAAVLEETLRRL